MYSKKKSIAVKIYQRCRISHRRGRAMGGKHIPHMHAVDGRMPEVPGALREQRYGSVNSQEAQSCASEKDRVSSIVHRSLFLLVQYVDRSSTALSLYGQDLRREDKWIPIPVPLCRKGSERGSTHFT